MSGSDKLSVIKVALTRELGANDKLFKSIIKQSTNSIIECLEIPCISFAIGPDVDILKEQMSLFDLIVITSPQAASVFIDAWESNGKPSVRIVTVGKGTSKPLQNEGIQILFEPSDATGETLAEELPKDLGSTILYPSSALADNKLVNGLERRGFKV